MRFPGSSVALVLIVTYFGLIQVGCVSELETDDGATSSTSSAGESKSAVPTTPSGGKGNLGSEGSAVAGTQQGFYSPDTDPLVNPPQSFETEPTDLAQVDEDRVLYRNLDGNPSDINPLFSSSIYESYIAALVYDTLFSFDAKLDWHVNYDMVAENGFSKSADEKTYTVRLRKDLKWHDGQPLTAHDVVFSYQSIMDDRVPCASLRTGTEKLESVTAQDDHTVIIVHKKPSPVSKWDAGFPIIPKHIYEMDKVANPDLKTGTHNNKYNRAPIGNGPYKFVQWLPNERLELERWDSFQGADKPAFKKMVFRIIPDNTIALLRFTKGDIDECRLSDKQFANETLVGSDFAKRGVKILKPQWVYTYIGWNMDGSNPFFTDKKVRIALAKTLDLERIRRELTYNLQEPCYGVFHPDNKNFSSSIQRFTYDLKTAAALLDEAGWKIDRERQGWRHKNIDGKPVRFSFTLLIPQGSSFSADLSEVYRQDLQSIGVELKTQIMEWATYQQRTRKHEFQACIAAWGTGTDPDTLRNIWHSDAYDPEGKHGRNYGMFLNAEVDALFEKGRSEFDPAKRASYYAELSKIIYQEQPYLFLFNRQTMWAVNKEIRGITSSPRGIFSFSPAEMKWWVPSSQYPAASRQ